MAEIYIQTSTKDIRVQKTVKARYMLCASVNGQQMIRVFMTLSLDTLAMCAVLADSKFKFKDIRKIEENYSKYIKALCKEF